jgi:hypothetical protein
VSGNGAYNSGMDEQVALFDRAVKAAVRTQPDAAFGALLVPRLAATARAATLEAEGRASRRAGAVPVAAAARRPRSRWAFAAQVAVAVALIPLLMTGLAFAGVTLPGPAQTVFEKVGIDLPNQPSDDDSSTPASDQGDGSGTPGTPDIASGKPGSTRHGKGLKKGAEKSKRGHGQGQAHGQGQSGSHGNSANAGNGGQGSGNGKGNGGGNSNSQGSANNQTGKSHAGQGAANGQGNGVSNANPPAHPVPPPKPEPPASPDPPGNSGHP